MGLFDKLKKKKNESKEHTKYVLGMSKSKKGFFDRLRSLSMKIDDEYFEELEQILIESDVSVKLALRVIEETRQDVQKQKISDTKEVNEILISKLFADYMKEDTEVLTDVRFQDNGPTVLLVVGVNGVGKTTSIAKLANRYLKMGKKVLLGAADTFRAGAVDQLKVWADRLGCPIVTGPENGDPASVAYDAVHEGIKQNVDLIIIDTAGRLQNKSNLMDELAKIRRVASKEIPSAPHEIFLVLDATTGQNGVIQAKGFANSTGLTGIIVTKMDGTSKGGIILSIKEELNVPVRFIGLGEQIDDLQEFNLEEYLYGLCVGEE